MASLHRIDADVHCAVPSLETLHPYLSEYWRDYLRDNAFRQPPGVGYSYPPWSPSVATVGSELTRERLRERILKDVDVAVLHCYYGVESLQHPYLAQELASAVNRWLVDEWLDRDERLRASLVVTPQFPAAAVEEVQRHGDDSRFVQLLLPARARAPYGDQGYWPIWEAAAERGLALCITYGGGVGNPPSPVNWMDSFFEEYATMPVAFQSHISSLIGNGVLTRWPGLKVVVAESGWTWLPSLMWRMDKEWKSTQREIPWVAEPPSEYVRRHVRLTTQPADVDAPHVREVFDQLGSPDVLMYGSDYPHLYGDSNEALLAELTPDEQSQVLWRNAADCYGLELHTTEAR